MNFSKISPKSLLLLILVLGLTLRIINLTIGFPMLYLSNDEAVYHLSALNMIANKTLFSLGNYGPLGSYLQLPFLALAYLVLFISGKVSSFADMELLLTAQEGYFMFIPRILSALFGTLTILSIYRLSIVLFKNKSAALWSSFFTAVSFNLVHVSHFARSLSPALFFTTLAVLFAVENTQDTKREFKNILFSFVFSAIAFGFHQVMGIVVIFPLIIALRKLHLKDFSKGILIHLFMWFALIIVFNYLSLGGNILQIFRSNNALGVALIRTPDFWLTKNFDQIVSTLILSIKMFWYLILAEGVILGFSIYGFIKAKIITKIRLAFAVFFLISMILSIFVFPPVLRYFLPTIVFVPLFAGVASQRLLNRKNILLALVVILVASFNSLYWNYLMTKEPTFVQMRKWLDKNIPPETPIAATFYRTVGYVPSRNASAPIRKFRPGYYLRAANLIGDNNYPYNVRNILYLESFKKSSKTESLKTGYRVFSMEYIVDAYYSEQDRLINSSNNLALVTHFSATGDNIHTKRIPELFADTINVFPLFVLDRPGPYFDILKVKNDKKH